MRLRTIITYEYEVDEENYDGDDSVPLQEFYNLSDDSGYIDAMMLFEDIESIVVVAI